MKVTAKSTIKFNGNVYKANEEIKGLTEKQVADLLAAEVVKVDDANIKPTPPTIVNSDKSIDTPQDKQNEAKGVSEVASLAATDKLTKEKLIGIARANGLQVEKTATKEEVLAQIQVFRKENNITVEGDQLQEEKPEVAKSKPEEKKEAVKPSKPNQPEKVEGKNPQFQNTNQTEKEVAPAKSSNEASKSK